MIEIQIVAADNVNETPELLKPTVTWLSTGAGFYMLYLLPLQHLPSSLLDLFISVISVLNLGQLVHFFFSYNEHAQPLLPQNK